MIAVCRERIVRRNSNIVENMINKFMYALATHDRTKMKPVVSCIEADSGDAIYIANTFKEVAAVYGINHMTMCEMGGMSGAHMKEPGVPKDKRTTKQMISATTFALSSGQVCIADDCVSISTDYAKPQLKMEDQKHELKNQFMRFRFNPMSDKYTGKDGASKNDDLIIAFMMIFHWAMIFRQDYSQQYEIFKNEVQNNSCEHLIIW